MKKNTNKIIFLLSLILSNLVILNIYSQPYAVNSKNIERSPVNEWQWIDSMTKQPQISNNIVDAESVDLKFILCGPDVENGIEYDVYTIGEQTQSITAQRFITPFMINSYETTYKLWYTVRTLSEEIGYVYGNPGQQGTGGRRGFKPTEFGEYEPVTTISWYDIIVWCNAFSELSGRTPCYTFDGEVLKDSTDTISCDKAQCNWDADGFRLPSESEWEFAARKTKNGYQRGDLPSGSINEYENSDDSIHEGQIAWFDGNSTNAHIVGTAGNPAKEANVGSGNPNAMGLYDMSGNILEYCWDWFADYEEIFAGERATGPDIGSLRIGRGGSWSPYAGYITCGDRYAYDPNEAYNYIGFRIAYTPKQ